MITNARVALKALKALKPASLNVSFGSKKKSDSEATEEKADKTTKKTPAKKKAE